jgi:protein SHQ1
LIDDGRETASYDLEKGEMHVTVAKQNKGEVFENLDMISLLLGIPATVEVHEKGEIEDLTHIKAPVEEDDDDEETRLYRKLLVTPPNMRPKGYKPSITLLDEAGEPIEIPSDQAPTEESADPDLAAVPRPSMQADAPTELVEPEEDLQGTEEDDWSHPQTIPKPFSDSPTFEIKYGFDDLYDGFFQTDQPDSVDISDPDGLPEEARRKARLMTENSDFNFDHYIADFMDTETIVSLQRYTPIWVPEYELLARLEMDPSQRPAEISPGIPTTETTRNDEIAVVWTDEHRDILIRLPKREYDSNRDHERMLGLVDLMFAYAYNLRTTEGENTVESSWTLVKLSSMMSWFDKLATLQEALVSSVRRALIYPLYRNWSLIELVLQDVYKLFYLGKRAILRSLIEMKQLCDISETKHLLSRLYLDDYCIWIQRAPRKRFASLASQLFDMIGHISKTDIGLPLLELESLAMEDANEKQNEMDAVEGSNSNGASMDVTE